MPNKLLLFLLLTTLVLLYVSCNDTGPKAGEELMVEGRESVDFTSVVMSFPGVIYLQQWDADTLRIETEEELLPEIVSYVEGGTLYIKPKSKEFSTDLWPKHSKPANFYITMKDPKGVTVTGAGTVFSEGKIDTKDFQLTLNGSGVARLHLNVENLISTLSGGGNFTLRGRVKNQQIKISGSGNYNAFDLVSQKCDVRINGAGNVSVNVVDSLQVSIIGAANVQYKGNPKVTKRIVGAGNVEAW